MEACDILNIIRENPYHKVPRPEVHIGTTMWKRRAYPSERRMVWFGKGRLETQVKLCAGRLLHFVIGCELESDARRVMEVLPRRFNRYGLTIHPEKTKLVRFGKPPQRGQSGSKNGTFDFLGFTHYWAKSRRGNWVIKRKTARKRQCRSIKSLWQWCKKNRHLPLQEQYRILCLKLNGHYQYYGIVGNYCQMAKVYYQAIQGWRYWLNRRGSQREEIWDKFEKILTGYALPKPRTIHAI